MTPSPSGCSARPDARVYARQSLRELRTGRWRDDTTWRAGDGRILEWDRLFLYNTTLCQK
jgi:hypothetical protein